MYWRRDRADHSAVDVGFVLNVNLVVTGGVRENRTVRRCKLRVGNPRRARSLPGGCKRSKQRNYDRPEQQSGQQTIPTVSSMKPGERLCARLVGMKSAPGAKC
jgi:hypothetical protein